MLYENGSSITSIQLVSVLFRCSIIFCVHLGIRCPLLESPEHGDIKFKSVERFVNDIAVYRCITGYDIYMDKSVSRIVRTCLQPEDPRQCVGIWSEKPPCCIRTSCLC